MQQNKPADFSWANLDGLFGILHTRKVLVHAARSKFRAYFAWSSGVIWCWSRFPHSLLARRSGESNVGCPTEAVVLRRSTVYSSGLARITGLFFP